MKLVAINTKWNNHKREEKSLGKFFRDHGLYLQKKKRLRCGLLGRFEFEPHPPEGKRFHAFRHCRTKYKVPDIPNTIRLFVEFATPSYLPFLAPQRHAAKFQAVEIVLKISFGTWLLIVVEKMVPNQNEIRWFSF